MSRRECLVGGICRTGSHAYNDERYPLDAMPLALSARQTTHGDDFISIFTHSQIKSSPFIPFIPSPSILSLHSPPCLYQRKTPASLSPLSFSLHPLFISLPKPYYYLLYSLYSPPRVYLPITPASLSPPSFSLNPLPISLPKLHYYLLPSPHSPPLVHLHITQSSSPSFPPSLSQFTHPTTNRNQTHPQKSKKITVPSHRFHGSHLRHHQCITRIKLMFMHGKIV